MAKKKSTRKKKCPSEELVSRCGALIEDEHSAAIDYSDLSDRAKTKQEMKTLRSMSKDEKRHEVNLKKMCICK
jgi:rubrerythrin